MGVNPLSFKEIIGIIKTAGEHHVAKLKYGALELDFHPRLQSNEASQIHIINRQVEPKSARSIITGGEEFVAQSEEDTKAMLDEFKRAQDLITDPESYEEDAIDQAIRE